MCDETEIRQKLKQFYSSLYERRSNRIVDTCMSYLGNISLPKLTDEEKLSCEVKLTKNECWIALSSMGNNKSLEDGLSKEFYICFLMKFITYLLESLNYSLFMGNYHTLDAKHDNINGEER